MCLKDMCKYFRSVNICHLHRGYNYASFKTEHEKDDFSLIQFEVEGPGGHAYIQINQIDSRCFPEESKYKYSDMRAIVARIENPDEAREHPKLAKLTYLKGMMGYQRDELIVFDNLKPGSYVIYVEFDWQKGSTINQFTLSYYGKAMCKILSDD